MIYLGTKRNCKFQSVLSILHEENGDSTQASERSLRLQTPRAVARSHVVFVWPIKQHAAPTNHLTLHCPRRKRCFRVPVTHKVASNAILARRAILGKYRDAISRPFKMMGALIKIFKMLPSRAKCLEAFSFNASIL